MFDAEDTIQLYRMAMVEAATNPQFGIDDLEAGGGMQGLAFVEKYLDDGWHLSETVELQFDGGRSQHRCQVRSYGVFRNPYSCMTVSSHRASSINASSRASYRLAKPSSSRRCLIPSRAR